MQRKCDECSERGSLGRRCHAVRSSVWHTKEVWNDKYQCRIAFGYSHFTAFVFHTFAKRANDSMAETISAKPERGLFPDVNGKRDDCEEKETAVLFE